MIGKHKRDLEIMRRSNAVFKTEFISEAGVKLYNRDYFGYVELDSMACYVLADGLDEDRAHDSAKIVVESITRQFTEEPSIHRAAIRKYMDMADKELHTYQQGMRLKASVIIAVTDYIRVRYASIGNTRLRLIRNAEIICGSSDQSLSEQYVQTGRISMDQVAKHEERNNLYDYLGQDERLHSYISKKRTLLDGDIILLFSRGIWENCGDGELLDALLDVTEPKALLDNVEEMILSKQPEDLDNYTIATIFADKIYRKPQSRWTVKRILLMILPILLIVGTLSLTLFLRHRTKVNRQDEMKKQESIAENYVRNDNFNKSSEAYGEALRLAKQLKKTDKIEELTDLKILTDQVILAEQAWKDGEYKSAEKAYDTALDLSYTTGNVGRNYIEQQIHLTESYQEVYDLLAKGDSLLERKSNVKARSRYTEAKELAGSIFFIEGRQEADNKIAAIDVAQAEKDAEQAKTEEEAVKAKEEAKAKAEAKAKEEETKAEAKAKEEETKAEAKAKEEEAKEAKAEEEAKAKEEAELKAKTAKQEEALAIAEEKKKADAEAKTAAFDMEKLGNDALEEGSLINAKMYYQMAKEMYQELGSKSKITALTGKIQLVDDRMEEKTSADKEADSYRKEAENYMEEKDYERALLLYAKAKQIYEEQGFDKNIEQCEEQMTLLSNLIKK